jgi:metal iron transporter
MKVSLSILLPFLSAPLIYLTSSKKVMRVIVYTESPAYTQPPPVQTEPVTPAPNGDNKVTTVLAMPMVSDSETQGVESIDMANGRITTILGWLIWVLITGLNVYLIVMLALGKT